MACVCVCDVLRLGTLVACVGRLGGLFILFVVYQSALTWDTHRPVTPLLLLGIRFKTLDRHRAGLGARHREAARLAGRFIECIWASQRSTHSQVTLGW